MQPIRQITFMDYLAEQHAAQYSGLDDGIPDSFDDWLVQLSPEEWIEFGDQWKKEGAK